MIKEIMRRKIAAQTKEYLAKGGVIEKVPRVIFCPASMEWARKRGWDWSPWNQKGSLGDQVKVFEIQNIGEGCYLTKPAAFEGSEDR